MSTVQEALKHEEVSTFTGDTTTTRRGLIEGEYLGHITNTRSIVRPVRPHFQARIYNYDVVVAQEGDDFKGNSAENQKYFRFCETLGVTPIDRTETIDGKETTIKLLPVLTEADMLGKPVIAVLRKVKDEWINNKGEKMHYSWRVSYVKPWTEGRLKDLTVNPEDLPF